LFVVRMGTGRSGGAILAIRFTARRGRQGWLFGLHVVQVLQIEIFQILTLHRSGTSFCRSLAGGSRVATAASATTAAAPPRPALFVYVAAFACGAGSRRRCFGVFRVHIDVVDLQIFDVGNLVKRGRRRRGRFMTGPQLAQTGIQFLVVLHIVFNAAARGGRPIFTRPIFA
jgi:hypothetical protein